MAALAAGNNTPVVSTGWTAVGAGAIWGTTVKAP